MNIQNISGINNRPTFGEIVLGRGGARRLAKTMPVVDANKMTGRNTFVKSDILITGDSVELITPGRNLIYKISKAIAKSKEFTDIEVFEHGLRQVFQIKPGLSDEQISAYGSGNEQIALAEGIAKFIDKNLHWSESVRAVSNDAEEKVSPAVKKAEEEITFYNLYHSSF